MTTATMNSDQLEETGLQIAMVLARKFRMLGLRGTRENTLHFLARAHKKYDSTLHGRFKPFAARFINNRFWRLLLPRPSKAVPRISRALEHDVRPYLSAMPMLDPRDRELLTARFGLGTQQPVAVSAVAQRLGCSRNKASRRIQEAINNLWLAFTSAQEAEA